MIARIFVALMVVALPAVAVAHPGPHPHPHPHPQHSEHALLSLDHILPVLLIALAGFVVYRLYRARA